MPSELISPYILVILCLVFSSYIASDMRGSYTGFTTIVVPWTPLHLPTGVTVSNRTGKHRKMEWTTESTLEFIKLYESKPVIWDPKHLLHNNRADVVDAWQTIQREISFKCTVADLKGKKESLMAAFRSLQKKVNVSGSEYKPSWFAYKPMAKFLKDIYQPVRRMEQEPEKKQILNTKIKEEAEEIKEADPISPQDDEEINDETHAQTEIVFQKKYLQPQRLRAVKRDFSQTRNNNSRMEHCNKMRRTCVCDEDQCSLYTRLLNKKLRNFDESTREVLMHEIDNMLFQAKFQGEHSSSYS